jgi:hypothetical protein
LADSCFSPKEFIGGLVLVSDPSVKTAGGLVFYDDSPFEYDFLPLNLVKFISLCFLSKKLLEKKF